MKSRILSRPGGAPIPWRQRGFGLIELIIAVFIGLFLLGGLAVVLQMTSNIFGSQTGLSLLQDEERLGMNLLTNVIEHAGYFPAPVPNPGNQQAMNISRANALVEYRFTPTVGVFAGYDWFKIDAKRNGGDGTIGLDQRFTGPMAGVSFTF